MIDNLKGKAIAVSYIVAEHAMVGAAAGIALATAAIIGGVGIRLAKRIAN